MSGLRSRSSYMSLNPKPRNPAGVDPKRGVGAG